MTIIAIAVLSYFTIATGVALWQIHLHALMLAQSEASSGRNISPEGLSNLLLRRSRSLWAIAIKALGWPFLPIVDLIRFLGSAAIHGALWRANARKSISWANKDTGEHDTEAEIVRKKWLVRTSSCPSQPAEQPVPSEGREGAGGTPLKDALFGTFRTIQLIHDRTQHREGLSTGFHELDDIISGLEPSKLYVIASRPAIGKTSLAMNIVENVALGQNKAVLLFSMDLTAAQIGAQMLCSHGRIESQKLRTGMIGENEITKLLEVAGSLADAKIFIDETPGISVSELWSHALQHKAKSEVDLIVVDYLQKIVPDSSACEGRKFGEIVSTLRRLSKEMRIPVLLLSQLKRAAEGSERREPAVSELREFARDADVVMSLHRDEYYDPDTERRGVADIEVAFNKMGPTDSITVAFHKGLPRFENLASV